MWWYVFGIGWVVCGVLDYGISFAYFQRNWPTLSEKNYYKDMRHSAIMALAGPCALVGTWVAGCYGHGFKWR